MDPLIRVVISKKGLEKVQIISGKEKKEEGLELYRRLLGAIEQFEVELQKKLRNSPAR